MIFLGADVGGTHTRVLVGDETGQVSGIGEAGPGNHEVVGYEGLSRALRQASSAALSQAGITLEQVSGAGFGVAGYDWPSERPATLQAIRLAGFGMPVEAVNDALIGLLAGSAEGWGVAVVSGTGCNCHGWDRTRQRRGQAIGAGLMVGEAGGASEIVAQAVAAIAHEWTHQGPPTGMTSLFVTHCGASSLADLLERLVMGKLHLGAAQAPLVLQAAADGDEAAQGILTWAGEGLGAMANGVIHQLGFEQKSFDVVMVGSMYRGNSWMVEALHKKVAEVAPGARLAPLNLPPVAGALLLGMEATGLAPGEAVRDRLAASLNPVEIFKSEKAAEISSI